MAINAHVETLTKRHQELEAEILSQAKHPSSDELHITELKRQKLKIKDQLEEMRTRSD